MTLIAPERSGAAVVGSGAADVDHLLSWDAPSLTWLFGGVRPDSVPHAGSFDVAIAYTRNATMVERLTALAPDVRHLDPDPPPNRGHASRWLAEPLKALGLHAETAPPVQESSPEEEAAARELGSALPCRFLAIHPGSGSPTKNWPAHRYADLVARVSPEDPWLLIEGPADAAAAAPLRRLPGAVWLSETPVRVLGALLSLAGAYVGNDSGVSHLAAAWGTPTVALFGPTDPAVWAPQGPIVEVVRSASPDIAAIPVDDVADALARVRSAALERPSG